MKNRLKCLASIFIAVSIVLGFVSCAEEHIHIFANEWSFDATHHWKSAVCEHANEVSAKAEHSFTDWELYPDMGFKERYCSVCFYPEIVEYFAPVDPDDPVDPDNPDYPNPDYPDTPDPEDPVNPDDPVDPNPDDPEPEDPVNPDDPVDPNPDDPEQDLPVSKYDVTDLTVTQTTIDSVSISWIEPEEYIEGYYIVVNGVESDLFNTYDLYDYNTGKCFYTHKDVALRSENGTEVTIKVKTLYTEYDENYNPVYKETTGVSVTATTKPFDGTLPAYTGNYSNWNLQSIKVGGTFDEKGYLSEYFDLATWEFKSSDETIATVDENGIVTGVKSGSAKIMFKNTDGIWYYREYTITDVLAKGMAINTIFSKVGGTLDADDIVFTSAEKDFAVSDKNFTWSVDDSSIATIADGKITFKKEGKVTVTATYNSDNTVTATSVVNVLSLDAILKENLSANEEGIYIDSESNFGFSSNALYRIVDGTFYKISSDLAYLYSLVKFDENFKNQDRSVEVVPVIEDKNTISVYYIFENASYINGFLWLELESFEQIFENNAYTVRSQINNTKEFVYLISDDGNYDPSSKIWNFGEIEKNETKVFKFTYQVKEHTGSLDATIF